VLDEAAKLGVLQVGFSGGEPLQRANLARMIAAARKAGIYTNLITSGIGLDEARATELCEAGLDSAQLSFQADDAELADAIAGTRTHGLKLAAAAAIRDQGIAFSANVVLHRGNLNRLREIIAFVHGLGAKRLELANTQYYGWAYLNRRQLLPTRNQIEEAARVAAEEKARLAGKMEIFYVLPDYYEERPKPCMNGWGQRYLTVNPAGEVLPCPTATCIPGLRFENVRERSLAWIWHESESFNRFRGTAWMAEPCRSCPQREIDFGGCRCQAAMIAGDATKTDPVCTLSPDRWRIDEALAAVDADFTMSQCAPRRFLE
jgi:pyrroloquinoline quinone biosynthesis protein E